MSALYLIRHGQAGPRHNYDTLSELGVLQAEKLGDYFAATGVGFDAVISGSLNRQRRTAEIVRERALAAGVPFPDIEVAADWDEFDLGAVYSAMAEPLSRDDDEFRREFEAMMAVLEDESHDVHRNHSYCDIAVIRAWVEKRYGYDGEAWLDFRERVGRPFDELANHGSGRKIAVFTSATPIGIWVGKALGLDDDKIWRLPGIAYNTGLTTFRIRPGDLRLFSFNNAPHLPDEALRTFR